MFIPELANIYSKKPYLSEIIPYHEIAPQIEQFLVQEVRLGARNLNPYRFSFKFAHNAKDVINLFIAFSSTDGPLKRLYRYECSDCDETNIITDEQLKQFKCYFCESDGDIETSNFLENVRVIFEIREPYLQDVKKRLKDQASFEKVATNNSGEAKPGDVSLKEVFEANAVMPENMDKDLLEIEKSILHKLSYGLSFT
jgi:hypothetical protein